MVKQCSTMNHKIFEPSKMPIDEPFCLKLEDTWHPTSLVYMYEEGERAHNEFLSGISI